ncbi:MAG: lipid-A-disaccharide synthase [Verrucomicrobia bacterium]|nr:lipid-A-disaccharide synthase [Verrucomicrobiota bacterium]
MPPQRILIVAGEHSGDLRGAELVRALKAIEPSLELFGIGGERMRAAGVELVHDITEISVTGFVEVLKGLPRFRRVFRDILRSARERRPDAAVLIDFPGFNLKLAKKLKVLGVPVVYYISPQVWAWLPGRIRKMVRTVSKMIVIFPFEEAFYRRHGMPVEFVGHPLVDALKPSVPPEAFRVEFGIAPGTKIVALLPGSRRNEVECNWPVMRAAAELIAHELQAREVPGTRFFVPVASRQLRELIEADGVDAGMTLLDGRAYDVIHAADAAIVCSGSATLETGCAGTPLVVMYRTTPLTYWIARRLVRVEHIGMINILAGERVAPEYIQRAARPEAIARDVVRVLTDEAYAAAVRARLLAARAKLGLPGAAARAAEAVLKVVAGPTAEKH